MYQRMGCVITIERYVCPHRKEYVSPYSGMCVIIEWHICDNSIEYVSTLN